MNLINYKYSIFITLTFLICDVTSFGFLNSITTNVNKWATSGVCFFRECCHHSSIPADFDKLKLELEKRVFGQHIVQDIVINALKAHWNDDYMPPKALTLSFHGWPGSGKNYVSNIIAENLYKYGSHSKFVHQYIGRLHFPLENRLKEYQSILQHEIESNVTNCGRQLFIFDEVDKMPPKLLDVIKPMIDYRDDVNGIDYRQCIFIFLSNTGAKQITDTYLEIWHNTGQKRDDLKLKDFEKIISLGAFNEGGGFYFSDTIKSNLIDHYIPFLPMERHHVELCVKDQFKLRKMYQPRTEHIEEVMEFIEWGPKDLQLFSETGCKRISQKVGVLVSKYSHLYSKEL